MVITLSGETAADTGAQAAPPGLTILFANGLARAGQQLRLSPRRPTVVGRGSLAFGPDALSDPKMSREHATFSSRLDHWTVTDGDSRNGTFVNGQRIAEAQRLERGDVVQLGRTLLVFGDIPPRSAHTKDSPLIGVSSSTHAMREAIGLIAATTHAVLLLGETGTGKEMAAQEIHRLSRREGPFVAVNCASLGGELLESQLFGYVKGAFTGANRNHDGLFRRADSGTLFLDEIGEMSEPLQARLLRVLQERRVRPVGSTEEFPVSTRIVAATNKNVESAVREGRFRADLYARLTEWIIRLPPLRKRREDIGVLVKGLLARSTGGETLDVDFKLINALVRHRWPLNIRGLANALTTARIAQPGSHRLKLVPRVNEVLEAQAALAQPEDEDTTVKGPTARSGPPDRAHVEHVIRSHAGNVAAAARELGHARQQVYRWLQRWGLKPGDFRPDEH